MQEEIKIIIIEDEEVWLRSLSASLFDFGYTIAGTADSFATGVDLFNNTEFDIALLDINLNDKNKGLELGKMLSTYYNKPFIFITASSGSHKLTEAIEARPSAYLTKPVHPAALAGAIQLAINNFYHESEQTKQEVQTETNLFFVKQGNRYKKIDWAKVVYLRSEKNYTVIFHESDKTEYFIRSTLSKTMNYIIPSRLRNAFVQINRAEAVQMNYIVEVVADEIKTAYMTLTLSEMYASKLKKAINIIL
jgi:DNA-binding LytR/AlgR family response regulator